MLVLDQISMVINDVHGDNKEIIRNFSIKFDKGKIYAITGPNGGGKTSIAKVIMGIYKQNQGSIFLHGEDISALDVSKRAQKGIVYAFQQPPRFKGITVSDLIRIARPGIDNISLRGSLRDVGLCPEDYLDRDVGPGLSGGEMKRIEIAQALARDAVVGIFDEPEAGVDLWTIQKLIGIITMRYKGHQATTIIITHNERVIRTCDEVVVVEEGMIKACGTPNEIWPLIREDVECKMKEQCGGEVYYGA